MFDPALFAVNLSLCTAAFGAAVFVPRDEDGGRPAVWLAGLLALNFIFCALAYTPFAPKHALAAIGLPVTSKDLWLLADALYGGAAIMFAFHRWWGWALWATAFAQVVCHVCYQMGAMGPMAYTDRLGNALLVQQAIFLFVGGRGAWTFLHSLPDRLRGSWHLGRKALSRAAGASE